jgi:hypothetical protein
MAESPVSKRDGISPPAQRESESGVIGFCGAPESDRRKPGGIFGRYLEPQAKTILQRFGLDVPRFRWAKTLDDALKSGRRIGYPLTAKVVSPAIYRKSDWEGVETRVIDDEALRAAFHRFSRLPDFMGILVEERCSEGPSIKVGVTRIDYGREPVIILESRAMYPRIAKCRGCQLSEKGRCHIRSSLKALGLRCCADRGARPPFNELAFEQMLEKAVRLVVEHKPDMEALIFDPVRCTPDRCIVLDVRVKLFPKISINL